MCCVRFIIINFEWLKSPIPTDTLAPCITYASSSQFRVMTIHICAHISTSTCAAGLHTYIVYLKIFFLVLFELVCYANTYSNHLFKCNYYWMLSRTYAQTEKMELSANFVRIFFRYNFVRSLVAHTVQCALCSIQYAIS